MNTYLPIHRVIVDLMCEASLRTMIAQPTCLHLYLKNGVWFLFKNYKLLLKMM